MATSSVEALLGEVLDYAGMFPPANLAVDDAVAMYAQHRAGADAWILGTLVVSAERVDELDSALRRLSDAGQVGSSKTAAWPVSVVTTKGSRPPIARLMRSGDQLRIAAIEFHPVEPARITELAAEVPGDVQAFFEVAANADLDRCLDAVATGGGYAKIRTGGVTPDAFPSTSAVYRFFRACDDRRLPAKATAGLHHAVTGRYPLTYEQMSARTPMYGFLNMCTAAALVHEGCPEDDVLSALSESSSSAFRFADEGMSWRNHLLSVSDLKKTREALFRSFGSCSVGEPLNELKRMRVL